MTQKIHVKAKGEILILKETINNMVDRLSSFCIEVQRVAKDVGVDGKMGAQGAYFSIIFYQFPLLPEIEYRPNRQLT